MKFWKWKFKLELLKTELLKAIKKFSSAIPTHTFGAAPNLPSVPIDRIIEQTEKYSIAIGELNKLADHIYLKYNAFIKTCRRTIRNNHAQQWLYLVEQKYKNEYIIIKQRSVLQRKVKVQNRFK